MSATVDDRIVNMQFNNSQFQRGATQTMSMLDRLKAKLSFKGSTNGINDLQGSVNKFSMGTIGAKIDSISGKFLGLATVAATALSNITNRAVNAGINMAKSLTLQPIMEGFQEYELKMGSIQTILSNTARYGTKLPEVTRNLDELNKYADKTIYNFGDMTKNIGLFTNAGIRIGDATSMIKGFSNEAAASGTNAQGAASAAYQLSQALSAGTIRLMDWRSLQNVGMGNKNMQNGLVELADTMGTLDKVGTNSKAVMDDFNGSLEKKWLSADVMSTYLKIMAGDMTVAEQKTLGLSNAQIKMFQVQQKNAEEAATKVRTFTQLIGTVRESIGSGWAETFDLLIGDFTSATDLFTSVNDVMDGMIGRNAESRNALLKSWSDMGGRMELIKGVGNIWEALLAVLKPIREAFRDIFPPATGKTLYDLTVRFTEFTKGLKIGADTADGLKRTFRGFFAILSIGWQVIKGVAGVIGTLVGALTGSSGGILDFTGTIGDFLVSLDEALKKGGFLAAFFEGLGSVLALPIKLLGGLGHILGGLFSGFDSKKNDSIAKSFEGLGAALNPLDGIISRTEGAWSGLAKVVDKVYTALKPAIDKIGKAFGTIGETIANSIDSGEFDAVLDIINTALLGGILLLVKKFFANGLNIDFGGGFVSGITDTFGALTGTLKSMQTQINAKTLLIIAGAIGILTAAVFTLSTIDSKALSKALSAMTIAFGQLLVAMGLLVAISSGAGILAVPAMAAAMVLLASAILILSAAVKNLSTLSWEELLKGLAGVGALLAMITLVAGPLTAVSGGLLRTGFGLIGLAAAIKILASAVEDMSSLSWGDMAKGLLGVAGALTIMIAAMYVIPPNILGTAAALLILGGALKAIASAVTKMGDQSWNEVAKGIVSLAASLAIIAGAMYLFPPNMLMTAAGLVLVGGALKKIAAAMTMMGDQSWSEVAKGLVTLGGSLWILSAGLTAMTGTLAGSAALFVAAAGLAVLTPVLTTLGGMEWSQIIKGLVGLAGTFAVLGAAGYLLGPVTPVLLGLGAAVALLGVGVAALGAGALMLATAFTMIVTAGSAGIVVMTGMSTAIVSLIPKAMAAFGTGLIAMAAKIAEGGPALVKAMLTVILSMTAAVVKAAPEMGKAFSAMIKAGTDAVIKNSPRLAEAGFAMLMAFMEQLDKNVYRVTKIAISIITKFITAIGNNQGRMVDAGYKMIIKFINSLANTIRDNSDEMGEAGRNIGSAIVEGVAKGIWGGQSGVIDAAISVAKSALGGFNGFLEIFSPSRKFAESGKYIDQGLAKGMTAYSGVVERSAQGVARTALETIQTSMSKVGDAISTEMDFNPTITPVLDLTKLQQDATQISGLLAPNPVQADVSTQQATAISAEQQRVSNVEEPDAPKPEPEAKVQFIQNNTSPKALSEIDIYRQTKNQLSLIKKGTGD